MNVDSTHVKGIRGAMDVYEKLLGTGLEVYVPVMYIGHDCVVRTHKGRHIDIEIKSRENTHRNFTLGRGFRPKRDFFVILHYYGTDDFWVLPSAVAAKNSSGLRHQVVLSEKKKQRLGRYYNAFSRIR